MKTLAVVACAVLVGVVGCSDEGVTSQSGPTFHRDVEPLLQRRCVSCHSPGRIAPFSLTSFAEAQAVAELITKETKARRMPPWGALDTDVCQPRHSFREDVQLSDAEIAMLEQWYQGGAPEGDEADAPPPVQLPADDLPDLDVELEADAPFTASGDEDQFRCFVYDPKLDTTKYVNGLQVVPGNPTVVHHAVLGVVAASALPDSSGQFDCFAFPPGQIIYAWTPGGIALELPPNAGAPIQPGNVFVMQIHYHPAGTTAEPDSTRLQLRYATQQPDYAMVLAGGGCIADNLCAPKPNGDGLQAGPADGSGPEFRIPAGVKGHTESLVETRPAACIGICAAPEAYIYGAFAHMHYLGKDETVSLHRADPQPGEPEDECLLRTPQWDFSWQRFYIYDSPIESLPRLRSGDQFEVSCSYDNTIDNPWVVKRMAETGQDAPVDVLLGEQSTDEMCGFAVPLLVKIPSP
jgi:hypothetical protein